MSVVGVVRGIQGSCSSLCVLPGPLGTIIAGVYLNVVSNSLSSSEVDSSAASSSGWVVSTMSDVCTSAHTGPKKGQYVLASL